jgi:transposase-like protein
MYSYEDRIRAVKLFIKLGRRTRATIRQLDYPTKNSLKSWHLEYLRHHDLPIGYVRSRPMYSHEQKVRAVDHYLTHGRCFAATLKGWAIQNEGPSPPGLASCIPHQGGALLAEPEVCRDRRN